VNKRDIRRYARDSVYSLLDAHLSVGPDDDLFVGTWEWEEDDLDVFRDEVDKIMRRIHRP